MPLNFLMYCRINNFMLKYRSIKAIETFTKSGEIYEKFRKC